MTTLGSAWNDPQKPATPPAANKPGLGSAWNAPAPTKEGSASPKSAPAPVPSLTTPFDYKKALTNPNGDTLPTGAKGWKPDGTPYFGPGLQGWAAEKAYNFGKPVKTPLPSDWTNLWNNFTASWAAKTAGQTDLQKAQQAAVGTLGLLGGGMALIGRYTDTTGDGSLLSPVIKGSKVAISAMLDALRLTSLGTERAVGTLDLYALGLQKPGQGNVLNRERMSLGDAWQASRIVYSGVVDQSKIQVFLTRYHAGEDPALLADELQNPWAEMVGQLVFDPMNVIGLASKGATKGAALQDAIDYITASGTLKSEEAANIIADFAKAPNDERLAEKVTQLVADHMGAVTDVSSGTQQGYKWTDLVATGNRAVATRELGNTLGAITHTMLAEAKDHEDITQTLLYLVQSVSQDADEAAHGVDGLLGSMSNPRILFSEPSIRTGLIMRELLTDAKGDVNMDSLINKLAVAGDDQEKWIKITDKLVNDATEKYYPTVAQMRKAAAQVAEGAHDSLSLKLAQRYGELDEGVKWISRIEEKSSLAKNLVNRVLGGFYFSQPGIAVRNAINDTFNILVDIGPGAFDKTSGGAAEFLNKWLGFNPEAAAGYSTTLGTSEGSTWLSDLESTVTAGTSGKAGYMQKAERMSSVKALYGSFKDNISKLIDAAFVSDASKLREAGFDDAGIKMFKHLVYEEGGDGAAALKRFNEMNPSGKVDAWRMLDYIHPTYKKAMQDSGFWDGFVELTKNPNTTQEDVTSFFNKQRDWFNEHAAKAIEDPVTGYIKQPDIKNVFDKLQAGYAEALGADAAFGDFAATKSYIEQADQASQQFDMALRDAVAKANQQFGPGDQANQLNVLHENFLAQGAASRQSTVAKTNELTDQAWELTNEIRRSGTKVGKKQLLTWWEDAGLPGKLPPDANTHDLLNALWDNRRTAISNLWETHFSTHYDVEQAFLDQIRASGVDTSQLEIKLQSAQDMSKTANEMRSAHFADGYLWKDKGAQVTSILQDATLKPQDKIRKIASAFGMGTYKVSDENLLLQVNSHLPTGMQPFGSFDDLVNRTDEAVVAMRQRAIDKGLMKSVETASTAPAAGTLDALNTKMLLSRIPGGTAAAGVEVPTDVTAILKRLVNNDISARDAISKGYIDADQLDIIKSIADQRGVAPEKVLQDAMSEVPTGIDLTSAANVGRLARADRKLATELGYTEEQIAALSPEEKLKLTGIEPTGVTHPPADATGIMGKIQATAKPGSAEQAVAGAEKFVAPPIDEAARQKLAQQTLESTSAWADEAKRLREERLLGKVDPGLPVGMEPTAARAFKMSQEGHNAMIDDLTQKITEMWGKKVNVANIDQAKAAAYATGDLASKMSEARSIALKAAEHWRDFSMLQYGKKTYMDLALSYALPYHFWYTHSYANWMQRLVTDPQVLAAYAKYRKSMEAVHANAPDWWKYNFQINNVLGIQLDHPLFMNLEQAIWPLQGLTGVDFNDPYKRVNWLTSTVDDLGKFGPSVWAPIQLAIAAGLQIKGQDDAAARWGGRLVPQTSTLKSLLAIMGVNTNALPLQGEYDPAVQFFAGGVDPYQANQTGRALGALVGTQVGGVTVTPEMAVEAARTRSGPLWDAATHQALVLRAPGKLLSFVAGVGFKARTTEDLQIDQFYNDYRGIRTNWNNLSPNDRKISMDSLRSKYPFMDTVLISRKGTPERDLAYSYNVLSRIPPGQQTQLLKLVGVTDQEVSDFYSQSTKDNGAPMSGWTEGDHLRWMAAMVDLGAVLKMPNDATQAEWTQAKNIYSQFMSGAQKQLGSEIWNKVTEYYNQYDISPDAGQTYLDANPDVNAALMMQQQFKIGNPLIYKYYGSLNTIYSYYQTWIYQQLDAKYPDIQKIFNAYDAAKLRNPSAKYPAILTRYTAEKAKLQDYADQQAAGMLSKLPVRSNVPTRSDFLPGNGTQAQQALYNAAQPQTMHTWGEWQAVMSPALQNLVLAHFTRNAPLSAAARNQLAFIASNKFGISNVDKALQYIGAVIQQP
jgi:hypothetical protein